MRRVALLTLSAAPLPCRTDTHACVACCRGRNVPERTLTARLRRQTRLFARLAHGPTPPGRFALVRHELRVRSGVDVLLAVVFLLPGVGAWARLRLRERMSCAFLGFDGPADDRPGCLLHPSRWGGTDRRRAAFALVPGMGCGEPGYVCRSATLYRAVPWAVRRRFRDAAHGLGWFAFSAAVERLEQDLLPAGRAPRPTAP